MTNKPKTTQAFAFRPSREALREFKDLSAEAKLNWLENALHFVEAFVSPAKRARWDRRWRLAAPRPPDMSPSAGVEAQRIGKAD